MTVAPRPKRSARPTVWAKSRAVIHTSAPRSRRAPTTGRRTSTWGLLVRSIQTRTGTVAALPAPRAASQAASVRDPSRYPRAVVTGYLLPIAPLTDPLVQFATNVVGDLGLLGIFVLMLFESACIPIPSEATMLFAGFNVSE